MLRKEKLQTEFDSIQIFIIILEKIAKIDKIVKRNEDLNVIIAALRSTTANLLGFRCES